MNDQPQARLFHVILADGRRFEGVQFSDGFVCVRYPAEYGRPCTIAVNLDGFLEGADRDPALSGAEVTWLV